MAEADDKKTSDSAPPAVTLVAEDAPKAAQKTEAKPKRRPRPAPAPARRPKPKAKTNGHDTIFLVETEEGSGQFTQETVKTLDEFLDIMDEDRAILVSRSWRRF